MAFRGNVNLWLPIAFAAIVSEATSMSSLIELRESLQQMNFRMDSLRMPEHSLRGVLVLTGGYFPLFTPLVVLAAFCAYLTVTRSFGLRGFLFGLPTALFVLSFGFAGVIAFLIFSTLNLPQPIFYYVVLRLPMFLGLVMALWIAPRLKNARVRAVRNLSSKLA